MAQLQEKLEEAIKKLQEDALNKNNTIKMTEEKLLKLEGQNMLKQIFKLCSLSSHRRTSITTCQPTTVYKEVFGSYCWCKAWSERKEWNRGSFEGGRV